MQLKEPNGHIMVLVGIKGPIKNYVLLKFSKFEFLRAQLQATLFLCGHCALNKDTQRPRQETQQPVLANICEDENEMCII